MNIPGKGEAMASFVLGITGLICFFIFGNIIGFFLSIILGFIGVMLSASSVRAGYRSGLQTAGAILSFLAFLGGVAIIFLMTNR